MTTAAPASSTRAPSRGLWAAIAVVLLALNLRPAIVAVSPLLDEISDAVQLTAFSAGLLVTLPVLCFAALGPLAPVLARHVGLERALGLVLVLIIAGCALRLVPSLFGLFGGTVLVGTGIAFGNILLPGLIKRDFPHRVGLMSGLFSMSLAGGATLAAGITVPVARAGGLDWNVALGAWGIFAVIALAAWLPMMRSAGRTAASGGVAVALHRDRVAWYVTAFFGLQSFNFYATTAWLPTILIARGADTVFAGGMLALINVVSIVPALVVPMLLDRMRSQAGFAIGLGVLFFVAVGGFLAVPSAPVLWVTLLGIAQGASLGLGLTLLVLRAPDADHTTSLSRMAQSWGYLLAAPAPLLLGLLNDVTGAWTASLMLLLVMLVPQFVAGYLAGRPGLVQGRLH
ncbi:MFS transporter [Cryobacterium sp. BB736]|uniref:CynX/NimT family MFS transporter n=1 Tax=Cryobacterium sp. BB736 TaxID=2746963 RepID=UPI001874422E